MYSNGHPSIYLNDIRPPLKVLRCPSLATKYEFYSAYKYGAIPEDALDDLLPT
jgi:hypothetical protein